MKTYHIYRIEYSHEVEFVADVSAEDAIDTFYKHLCNKHGFTHVNTVKVLFPIISITEE